MSHPVLKIEVSSTSSKTGLKSAEFSVLFCIFSLPDMITRTAVGEPQVRRKPVISRNGRLTGRFSLPFLRSLPVSAFLSNPLLTRVPSGACRSLFYAAPSLIFSRIPRKWVPSRNSYSPCKTRIIWGFPPRVRQGKRHSRVTKNDQTISFNYLAQGLGRNRSVGFQRFPERVSCPGFCRK